MDKGIMIDIDHLSELAISETVAFVRKDRGPFGYPLMASHGLFHDQYARGHRHERMRTAEQLATLRQLGGLVAVMTQDEMDEKETTCNQSSVSFVQNYNYASRTMGTVAFGSDFNGLAVHVGPRYGDDACKGNKAQATAQLARPRLTYPIHVPGFGQFDRQVTGQRTFDFNTDGLAHIGLYPDLLAEMALQGADIEPVMRSAEAYVTAWKLARSKSAGATPPPPSPAPPPPHVVPPPPTIRPQPLPLPSGLPQRKHP
jgi:microsomal dipeptidase-like Zn-dependent dipeptidase